MPMRNRVTPYGSIVAVPERGLLFGNRGVLHGPDRQVRREQTSEKRWISCLVDFKDRHHELNVPGRYTGLFFLDDAVALAAGHRPCAECRRPEYNSYLAAVGLHRAGDVDVLLAGQRGRPQPISGDVADLPTGTMVDDAPRWHGPAVVGNHGLLSWSHAGYGPVPDGYRPTRVLTPAGSIDALRAGFVPVLHPTAYRR